MGDRASAMGWRIKLQDDDGQEYTSSSLATREKASELRL